MLRSRSATLALICIGIVREFFESWIDGEREMPPQVLALLSEVSERRGEISPDPLSHLLDFSGLLPFQLLSHTSSTAVKPPSQLSSLELQAVPPRVSASP
jgi:hypothetical protein